MDLNKIAKEEISGQVAKSFVEEITRYHRVQASTMFHEAADYVKNTLLKMGLKDAAIEQFLADGTKKYWTYTSPMGWTVKSAELRLLEPREELIVRYEDVPTSLHTYSKATPPEGVNAELVDIGVGTKAADYEGKEVKGKFVLATGRARAVHEQAVFKYGAAGVITDTVTLEMPNVRESLDIPDAHAYQSIWPDADELNKVTFGFSISKRQGSHLRSLLKSGKKVKLNAKVDAKLFPGKLDVVTATIRGRAKPDEEIFVVAHLCHPKPSANDNASGSGLLMEIARTINALIASGKIAQPARTIRFIWVPETFGSIAYLHAHEDLPSRLVAGINLDMVGQDQELCRSTLNLDRTPDSLPSYLNDYVFGLFEESVKEFDKRTTFGSSSTFRYNMGAFSGGSDHAEFTDSTIGVPCIMLLQWPDLYYHTSMDTIDKVSEDSLKRVGWITAVAVLTLANATVEDTFMLASLTASRGMARIEDLRREAVEELFKKKNDQKTNNVPKELARELERTVSQYKNKIEHVAWRERQAIKSVKRLGENPELNAFLDDFCEDIADLAKRETTRLTDAVRFVAKASSLTPLVHTGAMASSAELERVPTRLFKGTFDLTALKKVIGEKEYEWYLKIDEKDVNFRKKTGEILNFINEKRSVHEITNAVSAEYDPTDPDHVLKFLRDLEKAKLISF